MFGGKLRGFYVDQVAPGNNDVRIDVVTELEDAPDYLSFHIYPFR